jgi:hypothetical protein
MEVRVGLIKARTREHRIGDHEPEARWFLPHGDFVVQLFSHDLSRSLGRIRRIRRVSSKPSLNHRDNREADSAAAHSRSNPQASSLSALARSGPWSCCCASRCPPRTAGYREFGPACSHTPCSYGSAPAFAGAESWRWRESNPRPSSLRQDFSGRSVRCLCSTPPVLHTSRCDGSSRCVMSR